ncbi:hypothetical protein ACTI_06600 [Actinoplanes sp. OR16]|uniref:hypothetical protein n=1 Tax=Actinoplanes sp. OR16 TaxID=946334 RepID=UPI000F6EB64D|nr:hypothetical protein [Actinoplanes sp. OR16]BBH63975.1 hypothetical protein ACTI_06600 [Actinoplanes sp. OR16]
MKSLPVILISCALALTGCGTEPAATGNADGGGGVPATSLAPEAIGRVEVFASESLRKTFDLIRDDFQARNPQAEVVLGYGTNAELAGQAADVLATDDPAALDGVAVSGQPGTFAGGRLTIAALNTAPETTIFIDYLREGGAQRILTDTGVLRP